MLIKYGQLKTILWFHLGKGLKGLRKTHNPYKEINDISQTIYIHIPKTGGISIEKAIFKTKVGHTTLNLYEYYDKNRFETYYKFGFVRNPWDRIVSSFMFLKQGGRNAIDADFSNKFLSSYESFENFILSLQDKKTRKIIFRCLHFRKQIDFITNHKGEISLDFLGRFETLEEDFYSLASNLDLDVLLPHENSSSRKKDYRSYYTKETAEIVGSIYREDVERLGYKFDS